MKKLISFLALSFCALTVNAQATHNMKVTFKDGNVFIYDMDRVESVEFINKDPYDIPSADDIANNPENRDSYSINGVDYPMPEAIDLGLPSGTKWASMNIGSNDIYDVGLSTTHSESENMVLSMNNDRVVYPIRYDWTLPTYAQALELCTYLSWVAECTDNDVLVRIIGTAPNGKSIVFNVDNTDHWVCFFRCWLSGTSIIMTADYHGGGILDGPFPGTQVSLLSKACTRAVKK